MKFKLLTVNAIPPRKWNHSTMRTRIFIGSYRIIYRATIKQQISRSLIRPVLFPTVFSYPPTAVVRIFWSNWVNIENETQNPLAAVRRTELSSKIQRSGDLFYFRDTVNFQPEFLSITPSEYTRNKKIERKKENINWKFRCFHVRFSRKIITHLHSINFFLRKSFGGFSYFSFPKNLISFNFSQRRNKAEIFKRFHIAFIFSFLRQFVSLPHGQSTRSMPGSISRSGQRDFCEI